MSRKYENTFLKILMWRLGSIFNILKDNLYKTFWSAIVTFSECATKFAGHLILKQIC